MKQYRCDAECPYLEPGMVAKLIYRLRWWLRWLYWGCLREKRFIPFNEWQHENM